MIGILIIIIAIQLFICALVTQKITEFKEVFKFPYDKTSYNTIVYKPKANYTFKVIVDCINSYIQNNGNRANDYHLMQDIVERNCDSKEEEIQSQIPTTLYLGLIGTMIGIIVGVWDLDISGLINSNKVETKELEQLLSGVGHAMIASVCGIVMTTLLTFIFKNAKATNSGDKNQFLSWIQANLLPAMTSDVNTALDKMSTALSQFNAQFAENTQKLNDTLSLVAETSKSQAELYKVINDLDITEMAKANVKVYKALKDSTDEIMGLAQMLHSSQEYVNEVKQLNDKLDKSEERTKMFEKMGVFFEAEIDAIEERKKFFLQTIDEVDKKHLGEFNKIAGSFESKAENAIQEISEKFETQNNELRVLAGKQEDIVKNSDLSSLPLKMKTLDEKISRLEQFVGKTQGNIIGAISQINTQTTEKETIKVIVKKNYLPSVLFLIIAAICATIALNGFDVESIWATVICSIIGIYLLIFETTPKK